MSSVPPPVWPAPEAAPETLSPAQPARSTAPVRSAPTATGTLVAVGVFGVVLGAVLGVAGDRAAQAAPSLNGGLSALIARSLPRSTTPAQPPAAAAPAPARPAPANPAPANPAPAKPAPAN